MVQKTFDGKRIELVGGLTSKSARKLFKIQVEADKWSSHQEAVYKTVNTKFLLDKYGHLDVGVAEVNLMASLDRCGKVCKISASCKECLDQGFSQDEALLKVVKTKYFCQIRYCKDPDCKCCSFARTFQHFKDIPRFKGLKTLMHFAFGFEPVSLDEFKNNYSFYRKKHDHVINNIFRRMRKKGWKLDGFRVLDFSFTTDGFVKPHYHLALVPVPSSQRIKFLTELQAIRASLYSKMKIKVPLHIQFFKHASIASVGAYLSIRASGLYKYQETIQTDYIVPNRGNLKSAIKEGKYMFLRDVISISEYLKHFYKRRHFIYFGDCQAPPSHGSNTMDKLFCNCVRHGEKSGNQLRILVEFIDDQTKHPDPPDIVQEQPNIQYISVVTQKRNI